MDNLLPTLVLCLFSVTATAEERPDMAATDEVLRFSTVNDFGSITRIKPLLTKAYAQVGYEIEILEMPAKRSLLSAENNEDIDGEALRVKGAESFLPSLIRIPVPIASHPVAAFVTAQNRFQVDGWASLLPYKVGIVAGYVEIDRRLLNADVVRVNDAEQLMLMLDKQRIDVAVVPESVGTLALKRAGLRSIEALSPPIQTTLLYHYLNKKHVALVEEVTDALRVLTGRPNASLISERVQAAE
ncbi:transporter substrate-binding domain-containing protein [Aestuariirhabdus sp. Z084]|uniref:substrate-binding periplasmic protein n=1 Tax=Aestuariirhabdus haliotis TaxID=2918751 RepID=UPI00201B3665|nr:transporter substrate-binding domain-containing protein [Aestuariirhabdus haliotis]MCL6415296.1 transporter substrate-binding domain-containing protein [Aestuariirhabdus haliotis]MCL6419556.1 transporter substrate-binding domain-containing protein [Aestuariirhabdus haliotis]